MQEDGINAGLGWGDTVTGGQRQHLVLADSGVTFLRSSAWVLMSSLCFSFSFV